MTPGSYDNLAGGRGDMTRQYLVFGGRTYYPNGGWHDFRGRFDSLVEAERAAAATGDDWWHIVDAETGEFVASSVPKWER